MRKLIIEQSITQRTVQLQRYLDDISKEALLSADEEVTLGEKIRNGDQAAMDRLVKANLRFVISVAKKYQNNMLSLEDLISEGNLGLIKAARVYDPTRGFKFISFAVWWIRQSMMMAIDEKRRLIRLPFNQLRGVIKAQNASEALEQILERKPTLEEIAEFMDIEPNRAAGYIENSSLSLSLDKQFEGKAEDGHTLKDIVADKHAVMADGELMRHSITVEIKELLNKLRPKERTIIEMNFGIGCEAKDTEEIARMLEISKERVRQIKIEAIGKLRQKSKIELLF